MAVDFGRYFISLGGWLCGVFGVTIDRRLWRWISEVLFLCNVRLHCFHTFPSMSLTVWLVNILSSGGVGVRRYG